MNMVSEKLTIINKLGLHMRPARTFVQTMAEYQSTLPLYLTESGSTERAL
jgi:phosphotransferase system HPr (HPr) family protein